MVNNTSFAQNLTVYESIMKCMKLGGLRYRHILLFCMVSTALTCCFVFALLSYTIQLHLLLS